LRAIETMTGAAGSNYYHAVARPPQEDVCFYDFRAWLAVACKCIYSRYCCWLCLLAPFLTFALFAMPGNPVWSMADSSIKSVIEYTASDVTGVRVEVGAVTLGLWHAQAEMADIQTFNPLPYTATPYFMKIDHVKTDVSWARLFWSQFSFLEIEEIQIRGLSVYIEMKTLKTTNLQDILTHVEQDPLVRWAGSKLSKQLYKGFLYTIDRINVQDMRMHVVTAGGSSTEVKLSSFNVLGIGVKENGINLGELIGRTIKALSEKALRHESVERDVAIPTGGYR